MFVKKSDMIAFETKGTIDDQGFLSVKQPIALRNRKVRVLVLLQDSTDDSEWIQAISANPSFDFLHDEAEAIYSSNDGFALNHEK